MNFKQQKNYDVSTVLTSHTVVYPGDPSFEIKTLASLAEGSVVDLKYLAFSNHIGTHIDFPAHVIKDGKTSTDYSLDNLIMRAMVVEVPESFQSITAEFIKTIDVGSVCCLLFKTSNSNLSKQDRFVKEYVYLELDAAKYLLNTSVRVIGIDYLSVDAFNAEGLPVHNCLLSNEILILENLELKEVPTGEYTIYIMPMNIPNMDGLPARVMLSGKVKASVINSNKDVNVFLDSMRSSIFLSHLALNFWINIGELASEYNFDKNLLSLFIYQRAIYYRVIITEMAKIFDPHPESISFPNVKNYILGLPDNDNQILSVIDEIRISITEQVKSLMYARNKFISHNDMIKLDTNEEYNDSKGLLLISIKNLELLINKSALIYNKLHLLVNQQDIRLDLVKECNIRQQEAILKEYLEAHAKKQ